MNRATNVSTTPSLNWRAVCALIALAPAWAHAQSQTAPVLPPAADPSVQEQDRARREKLLQQREEAAPAAATGATAGAGEEDAGAAFVLQRVRFTPSRHLSREQLTALAQPYVGRSVHLRDLQALVTQINKLYRQLGIFTAAATLPEQQVKDGGVVIQLVEGRLGQVMVEKNVYLDSGYVQQWVHGMEAGGDVDAQKLEGDVARFNRVNDAKLQAALRAGQDFGKTDLVLAVDEPARNSGQVFADNYGYKSSGRTEAGIVLRRQKVLLDGDRGIVYALATQGTRSLSLSYNAAVGASGWRLGANASANRTKMVAGDFRAIDVKGSGSSFGLDASDLVYSGGSLWLNVVGGLQYNDSSNDVRDAAVSHYGITRASAGVAMTTMGDGWQWSLSPTLTHAHAQNKLLPAQDVDVELFSGDSTLVYRLGKDGWYGLGQLNWQLASRKSLPGALAFSVGGPVNVRGYESGQISGDEGAVASAELHYDGWTPQGTRLDLFGFLDTSEVHSVSATVHPTAAGLGLTWGGWHDLSLSLVAGRGLRGVVPDQRRWNGYARLSWSF